MAYVRSPILIGDNKWKYSSHQPWIHGTSPMWTLHVWCCVTDFSSLTALLEYLVTCKIRAQLPPPDGRYQIICNFVRTCYKPRDYANLIFDRCVAARLCQQTRFIVPVESAGANRVPIVPEDSGSHRHREDIDQTVNSHKTLHSWPSRTICGMSFVGTVRCRYNVVQYTVILYTALQWQGKTLHTFLPQQVRSAVSIVRIFGENWLRYSRTALYIRENDHILSEASIGLWVLSLPSPVFVCVHVCLCESNISLSPR